MLKRPLFYIILFFTSASRLILKKDIYANAAVKNLKYLHTCIQDILVGCGPRHRRVMDTPPCIYPTFARAKNLAMAHSCTISESSPSWELPSESRGLHAFFTLELATVGTENIYSTFTAYGYKDSKGSKSKYMYRPRVGCISNLYICIYGSFTSSQTEYHRWEPMYFSEAPGIECLTSRIEYESEEGYFTHLYEFDDSCSYSFRNDSIVISALGELKNKYGGIAYSLENQSFDDKLEKSASFRFLSDFRNVRIIEPVAIVISTEVSSKSVFEDCIIVA